MEKREAGLTRRNVLIAGIGAVVAAVVAACSKKKPAATPTPTPTNTGSSTPGSNPTPTPTRTVALSCVETPDKTEGPYFVDEKLNRSDIRTDPSNGTTKDGVPVVLNVSVYRIDGNACTPISGALLDVWHCDAVGAYSDVAANNTEGEKFLRGYQVTDSKGAVRFTTIYPGWYSGRAVHIHFKVRVLTGAQQADEFNSQWFFDDTLSRQIFTSTVPYKSRGAQGTTNNGDGIYGSNGSTLQLNLAKSGQGYAGSFAIGLRKSG